MLAIQEDEEAGILQLIVYKLFLQDVPNRLSLAVDFVHTDLNIKLHLPVQCVQTTREWWTCDRCGKFAKCC